MRSLRSLSIASATCVALGLAAPPVFAQTSAADRATARSLGVEGQHALENNDYKTAEDRYRRAESLVNAPTLLLGLARALAGLGRFVEAQEAYNRIIREGVAPGSHEAFKRALADAKREVEGVGEKVGGVTITVHGPGGADVPDPKVVLDGVPVSTASLGVRRSIDPGSHVLQVSADGFKPAELRFDVTTAGSVDQPVTLQAEPAAAPAPDQASAGVRAGALPAGEQASTSSGARGVLPWVAFGLGAVGLGVGGVAGVLAMNQRSKLTTEGCNTNTGKCPLSAQPDVDTFHTVARISDIGFIAGGVGVVTGVILLLTQPQGESATVTQPTARSLHIVPVVGLGSIGAVGEF